MSTHVIQVRDLVTDLLRHRQEAPVVFSVDGNEYNFDRARKNDYGVVEVLGVPSADLESEKAQFEHLEDLESKATELLECFDRIMGGEIARTPHEFNAALDALHEKVEAHLKNR